MMSHCQKAPPSQRERDQGGDDHETTEKQDKWRLKTAGPEQK